MVVGAKRHVYAGAEGRNIKFRNPKFWKCKVLCLGQGNPQYPLTWEDEEIEKDWDALVSEKLGMSQQCALVAHNASCFLGFIKEGWPADQRK